MLTNKFQINDVVTLKLLTGEEVIGYFVSEDADSITLRKPVTPMPAGQGQMGLAPVLMSADYMETNTNLKFNRSTVVVGVLTGEQFKVAFTQSTSGLDLSSTSKPGLIT